MREQRLQKYRPGDEIDLVVQIEHPPHAFEGSERAVFLQGTRGRDHHYSAEELDEMGFKIVEEPDNRPVLLQIEMGFRTDY